MSSGYILGISRGHNAGACLLKDGKIVFAIEEERLSRHKYDGGPLAAMMRVKQYTDKLDFIFVSHTQPLSETSGTIDYTGDNIYVGMARKMGLIDRKVDLRNHPQVIDYSYQHHKIHAACAFYRSEFDDAVAVVIDGAGSATMANHQNGSQTYFWEVESIFDCSYPNNLKTLYKHSATRDPIQNVHIPENLSEYLKEEGTHEALITNNAGITKTYEAVTEYCGFSAIEAGKTMGLFPYGKPNDNIPKLFDYTNAFGVPLSNRNLIVPTYPNSAIVNSKTYSELAFDDFSLPDATHVQNRRDLAYALQTQTQEAVLHMILKAVEMSGKKKVVFSGGYALNCVANYFLLNKLNEEGIELYVEPISNDGGTAIGAALLGFYNTYESNKKLNGRDIYLGFEYKYSNQDIDSLADKYGATVSDATHNDIVELMTTKNIVACFQGKSENGPRALGNRSLMFDPTFKDGKDFVNEIKHREYFRPFAGSILEEDANEWFDLRGMPNSPHMMYAVNCKPGVEEKIPAIIHVDGTCRIQTVSRKGNPIYYDIIKAFKDKTGIPIIFNTSFNLGGEPLVETLEDALWTLQQSDIEYLYLPEYGKLIKVSN
jgi:carbamoyltransferase